MELEAAHPRARGDVIRLVGRVLTYLAMVVAVGVFFFPIYWIVLTSLKTRLDVLANPPVFFFKPTFANYKALIDVGFVKFFINSVVVVSASTILAVGIGALAAYALARWKTTASEQIGFWILSQRMFPPIVVIIPLFLIIKSLGLLDTYFALILVYTLFNLPLAVWVMKPFFDEIPIELEEAAMIDGHSFFTTCRRVIFPLAAPGIVTAAVLSVVFTWNEFLFALILTSLNSRTMTVAAITFIASRGIEWGKMAAAAVVIMIPMLVLVLTIQKRLVKGMTYGAVKN